MVSELRARHFALVATRGQGYDLVVLDYLQRLGRPEGHYAEHEALAMLHVGSAYVMALVGTSLLNPGWFRGLKHLAVALDNDQAGILGRDKIVRQLAAHGIECLDFSQALFGSYKDFASYWAREGSIRRSGEQG